MLRESKRNNLAQHYYLRSVLKKLFLSFAFIPYAEDNKIITMYQIFLVGQTKKLCPSSTKKELNILNLNPNVATSSNEGPVLQSMILVLILG